MTTVVGTIEGEVWKQLENVKDPEIPSISVVEMGMIHRVLVEESHVVIEFMPTFVGCPALKIIEQNIVDQLSALPGVTNVQVELVFEPAWTSERISETGREKLRQFGIAPPPGKPEDHWEIACPYCGSRDTTLDNLFGPAACRSIAYCRDCRNPFEALKPIY
ncbi:1,2-phenylacetyl-CoA epoxidase subunit PaaD [Effusibacillus lacus]|uniref:Phenylacetate-CoA oxygenase subunit PaaJ n=1 Tax=Effusibacillus lacus TaxID=1348429 RepID=A0A292YG14_9BACL|nr:1,2-phenylacetyl-CoA epoxidase subunit PaaD [Effusibacillus lacus]TCS72805.1 ring-1,2-phenylacetyl-CoA epoxidase subunit PaaD [Effusibacillus lacus]GAX89267.1 phenylacetate-CoA oxygenase subunit PaaJ [Effusibacillus lacus]